MLDGALYQPIYILILTVLTIGCSIQYASYSESSLINKTKQPIYATAILTIAMILFIGFRPVHRAFVDMKNYYQVFYFIKDQYYDFIFDITAQNLIFDNIFSYYALNNYQIESFFFIIAVIYFGCIAWAIRRLFPNDTFYALVIYLSAFSTFSYATNGIKAGAAAAIFLVAISYYNKTWISLLLALISWGFHHSMQMVVLAYILTLFVKNTKYYLVFWVMCIIFSALHINPLYDLMIGFTDESGLEYLTDTNENWGGKTGFRLDFIIYSSLPVIIGYYAVVRCKINDSKYTLLFNLYLLCNALWVLSMYIPYNNRIAYLSWFMLPIISIYPMLNSYINRQQYIFLNIIVYTYLVFSILMIFI